MDNEKLRVEILAWLKPIMATWDVSDLYAVSLWVNNTCDNPCEPTVALGYNTEAKFEESLERASGKEEARWNYAFWLQNREFVFGEGETGETVKQWIEGNNLPYFPCVDYDFTIPDGVDRELLETITREFVDTLVEVVRELHDIGFIESTFGKAIPVIIHELEYYDVIARQNEKANPECAIAEFVQWIDSRYNR